MNTETELSEIREILRRIIVGIKTIAMSEMGYVPSEIASAEALLAARRKWLEVLRCGRCSADFYRDGYDKPDAAKPQTPAPNVAEAVTLLRSSRTNPYLSWHDMEGIVDNAIRLLEGGGP